MPWPDPPTGTAAYPVTKSADRKSFTILDWVQVIIEIQMIGSRPIFWITSAIFNNIRIFHGLTTRILIIDIRDPRIALPWRIRELVVL